MELSFLSPWVSVEESVCECFSMSLYLGCLPAASLLDFALRSGHPAAPALCSCWWDVISSTKYHVQLHQWASRVAVTPLLPLQLFNTCALCLCLVPHKIWNYSVLRTRRTWRSVYTTVFVVYIYQQRQEAQKTEEGSRTCPEPHHLRHCREVRSLSLRSKISSPLL